MCFLLFAKFAGLSPCQGQIVSMKFARCLRKCFRLREFFDSNIDAITMMKRNHSEVQNVRTVHE